jgi:hypothetical protein
MLLLIAAFLTFLTPRKEPPGGVCDARPERKGRRVLKWFLSRIDDLTCDLMKGMAYHLSSVHIPRREDTAWQAFDRSTSSNHCYEAASPMHQV